MTETHAEAPREPVKAATTAGALRAGADTDPATGAKVAPGRGAYVVSLILLAASLVVAGLVDKGRGFAPRVDTLDALAGLSLGAFLVDRLLTFVPPVGVRRAADERAADLQMLRFGYGAVLGAIFVVLTDLRAVQALTSQGSTTISPGVDRAIAVLAIAGGVAGLARLLSAINPQPATDADSAEEDPTTVPAPKVWARLVGLGAVAVAAIVALHATSDDKAVNLLAPDKLADGTIALIVRFGTIFLAAAIVQQLVEFVLPDAWFRGNAKANKPVVAGALAVVLGVVAAWIFDLYLMHNIGFFEVPADPKVNVLAGASDAELWGDAFVTGLVIAAGTKPVHDIVARLRKAKKTT